MTSEFLTISALVDRVRQEHPWDGIEPYWEYNRRTAEIAKARYEAQKQPLPRKQAQLAHSAAIAQRVVTPLAEDETYE